MPAKDAIAMVKTIDDPGLLDDLLAGEERVTVLRAGEARREELAASETD
jgi:hypothetical protein